MSEPFTPLIPRIDDDIRGLLDRFAHDRFWAVTFWNAYRDKGPMLAICQSSWRSWTADELLTLPMDGMVATTQFYETLERFHLWVSRTEAMPATLEVRYDAAHDTLKERAQRVSEVLGLATFALPNEDAARPATSAWTRRDEHT